MKLLKIIVLPLLLVLGVSFSLVACNTIAGAADDISKGGAALKKAATGGKKDTNVKQDTSVKQD